MELRQYKQWLWFKRIRKIDLKGKKKILKLPVSPITFKSDDWNNKEQWAEESLLAWMFYIVSEPN